MRIKLRHAVTVLFVLTALTSNIVGSTLAKYTTSATSTDAARVAKWGITVTAEGNLFGDNYTAGPANTICENTDGSITVKSHHTGSVSNIVAPGTENNEGLVFGFKGVAETALKLEVTIQDQNIVLRPNVYYIMHKITEAVTEDNLDVMKEKYGDIYYYEGSSKEYTKMNAYKAATAYYSVYNKTDLTSKGNWAYCPVVFEIYPTDGKEARGLVVARDGIKSFTPTSTYPYYINVNDKSLDIISFFLQNYSLNGGQWWPTMSDENVFKRTVSKVYAAGTNLETISLSYDKNIYVGMNSERLVWKWDYQQAEDTELYDNADNILGRLAAEELYGPFDDEFVVIENRTAQRDKNNLITIIPKNDGKLIAPEEYVDYCLDTMFNVEITISQVD